MGQKDRRIKLVGQNEKGKYERTFGLLKIRNLIQMVFV
jgi:hypothetical protein